MDYVLETTRVLEELGAHVIIGSVNDIPMFDIVCRPIPFEPNEAEALQTVIRCARDYYSQVISAIGVDSGTVILDPLYDRFPDSVSIRVGMYAEDDTNLSYVGFDGGNIVKRAK